MDKVFRYIIYFIIILCMVMLVLVINKSFMSMNSFPGIFGMTSAVITVLSLLLLKKKGRVIYIFSIISLGLGLSLGPLESWVEDRNRLAKEKDFIDTMDNRAMPLEPYTILHGDSNLIARSGELFTDKYSILNFWAPWCSPCLKEMPMLNEFYTQVEKYDVQIIGITGLYRRKDLEDKGKFLSWAERIYSENDIAYPIIFDENSGNALKFKTNSLPLTILLDHHSRIIEYRIGIKGARIIMDRIKKELNIGE